MIYVDGAAEKGWYGGGGDSALGDSVTSTDDVSDPTSRHRGYSGYDDDDDVIADVIGDVQVADVARYFDSLQIQYRHQLGNTASTAAVSFVSFCFAYICFHSKQSEQINHSFDLTNGVSEKTTEWRAENDTTVTSTFLWQSYALVNCLSIS